MFTLALYCYNMCIKEKSRKHTENLSSTHSVEQLDLGDIYRGLHPTWQTTLFISILESLTNTMCGTIKETKKVNRVLKVEVPNIC